MDTCNVLIKRNEVPMGLIDLKGTYKYSTRDPAPQGSKLRSRTSYLSQLTASKPSKVLKAVLESATAEFEMFKRLGIDINRYLCFFPSIPIDRYNSLEIVGSMSYSKTRAMVYSFHDKLDYALAYLFKAPLADVREHLLANCKQYNIDYEMLSYAFCSMNIRYIETMNLKVFLGISDILDSYIMDIIWQPQNAVYTIGDVTVSLADSKYTTEERITTFLLAQVGYFLQLFINTIIMLFKQEQAPFVNSRYCMLVSKGSYNVVITVAGASPLPDLSFTLEDMGTMYVKPVEAHNLGVYNEDNWYNSII